MPNKTLRIGIIGAGPGGLAAAETLRELGYTNVTVLEKRPRVGGQSFSETYTTPSGQNIIYDLGSMQPVSTSSGMMHKLLTRYDLHLGRTITLEKPSYFKLYDCEQHKVVIDFSRYLFGKPLTVSSFIKLVHDISKLIFALRKYKKLTGPGFDMLSDAETQQLSIPYEEWVDQQNFKIISEDLKIVMGFFLTFSNTKIKHTIPAMKFVKILLQLMKYPPRYVNGTYLPIREGYQELWNRVANANHVKLNTHIKEIKRSAHEVTVVTESETMMFDKLIIACASFEIQKFLDLSAEEKEVFSKVRYCPGWRGVFTAKNLPHDAGYYMPEAYLKDIPPTICGFIPEGQIDEETWLYSVGFSLNGDKDIKPVLATAEALLAKEFNAKDIKWVRTVYWPEYGSYFDCETVKEGIYTKVAALQGAHNTYFAGDIISSGVHAIVANYSEALINKYFK